MKSDERAIDPRKLNRLEEASEWLFRLQEPARTEADINEWLRWCDSDSDNLAAFEAVQRKWCDLDALKTERLSSADELRWSAAPALPMSAQKSPLFGPKTSRAPASRWHARLLNRTPKTLGIIAASLLAVVLTSLFFHRERSHPITAQQQFAAAVTNRATTLPDGSKMILGAKSLVNMDFNGPRRQLDLSSGEAYFKVKHDRARPFVVQAGEVSVTAIGTAFDVRLQDDKVTVTVEEGTVEVRGTSFANTPSVWRAEAGYQVAYSTRHRTASIASINPAAVLTWRSGELAYIYEPLGSVVDDLNRYSTKKIVIADPGVAKIPFTGTAWANSLDGWLAGIQQAYPVEAEVSSAGEIVLRSRQ